MNQWTRSLYFIEFSELPLLTYVIDGKRSERERMNANEHVCECEWTNERERVLFINLNVVPTAVLHEDIFDSYLIIKG